MHPTRQQRTIAEAGVIAIYLVALFLTKQWFYAGWQLRAFLSDLGILCSTFTVAGLAIAAKYVSSWFHVPAWMRLVRFKLNTQRKFVMRLIWGEVLMMAVMLGAFAVFGPGDCLQGLIEDISNKDFPAAQAEADRLRKLTLEAGIQDGADRYLAVSQKSASFEYTPTEDIHRWHEEANDAIGRGENYDYLNSLSIAETERMISLGESDPDSLAAGEAMLQGLLKGKLPNGAMISLLVELSGLETTGRSYQAAIDDLKKALNYNPSAQGMAVIHGNIGTCYAAMGNYPAALEEYKLAEPNYPEPYKYLFYSNYGYVLLRMKQYAEAERIINRALEINGQDWYSHLNLGLAYEGTGDYDQSAAQYSIVIASNTVDVKKLSYALLGRVEEIKHEPSSRYLSNYIQAIGETSSPDEVQRMESSKTRLSQLYAATADAIRKGNSFGLEAYIDWFNKRAAEVNQ